MIGNIFTNIRKIKSSHLLHVSNKLKNKKVYEKSSKIAIELDITKLKNQIILVTKISCIFF